MKRLIILGAGASVDSGIRTYRGPNGIYKDNTNVIIPSAEDLMASEDRRLSVFRTLQQIYAVAAVNSPGPTYEKLQPHARDGCVVTQNVDGYAPASFGGIAEIVVEFHGTMKLCECMDCGKQCPTPAAMFNRDVPIQLDDIQCPNCVGGRLRPCTVLMEEPYKESVRRPVYTFIGRRRPREVLVVGTTLVFAVFRDFINKAKQRGAKIIHINPDPSYGEQNVRRRGEIWFQTIDAFVEREDSDE